METSQAPLLLSRTLDPTDYAALLDELAVVGDQGMAGQHPHKRWEWALALHAINRWIAARPEGELVREQAYVVGGGSANPTTLAAILKPLWAGTVNVLDPDLNGLPLETIAQRSIPLAQVILVPSVIDCVLEPEPFLYYLSCVLAPGGLLVLTMPFWNRCGPDTAYGHEWRRRIFCPKEYGKLRQQAQALQLATFGGVDPLYHGPRVHDYTYASLVLEKRR